LELARAGLFLAHLLQLLLGQCTGYGLLLLLPTPETGDLHDLYCRYMVKLGRKAVQF
jgi:hypothetical protein